MKVIVVGAGISGLSAAWSLAKRGHAVTLIEQGPIPNPLSASGDHHRIIRRAYGAATGYGRLITEAFAAWEDLWQDLGAVHYDPRGFMAVSREEGDEADLYLEGLKAGRYPFELCGPDEAVERWPFLEPGSVRFAFFSREGGALHCRRIASGIAGWLRRNDAEVMKNAAVSAVDPAAAAVTLASGERLVADRVVMTAGAWVLGLFPDLGAHLKTYRTAVVYLDPPPDLKAAWDAAPVILDVGGKTDGYILPPSGEGGLKFGSGLHKEPTFDPDADRSPRPGEGEEIRDLFAPPIARVGEYGVRDVVSCAYTFTADERFFATRKRSCLIVSACSGHGYKFGAAVGRRIAEAVETGDPDALARWLRAETDSG